VIQKYESIAKEANETLEKEQDRNVTQIYVGCATCGNATGAQ